MHIQSDTLTVPLPPPKPGMCSWSFLSRDSPCGCNVKPRLDGGDKEYEYEDSILRDLATVFSDIT